MTAIFKREWSSLFHTMTAPVFLALLLCVGGIYFNGYSLTAGYPYFSYTLMSIAFILLVAVPLLTMRSFSEDRKQKSDQLLLTAPLRLTDIVLGKYFAMCAVLGVAMAVFCVCPLIIRTFGVAYFAVDYASILVFFLIGCFFIAVGMWISSMTESQVIAAVCTFGALLLIYLWDDLVAMLPTGAVGVTVVLFLALSAVCLVYWRVVHNWIAAAIVETVGTVALAVVNFVDSGLLEGFFTKCLSGFSVTEILQNFAFYSLFDVAGVVKLLLAAGVMLFLTALSVEKRRWS